MKTLLLLLLCSAPVLAQQGYRTEGQKILWEKTYPGDTDIVALLDRQPALKLNTTIENVHQGSCDQIKNTCTTGSVLMKNDFSFDFTVIGNPGNYTVRVTNIKILERFGPMRARIMPSSLEKHFLSGNALKADPRSRADLRCLETFFSNVFSPAGTTGGALTSN